MGKPTNIAATKTTAHSQQAELAQALGVKQVSSDVAELQAQIEALTTANTEGASTVAANNQHIAELEDALKTAIAAQATLTGELEAEKAAHAKTTAALAAATAA